MKCTLNRTNRRILIRAYMDSLKNFRSLEGMGNTLREFLKRTYEFDDETKQIFTLTFSDWVKMTNPLMDWSEDMINTLELIREGNNLNIVLTAALNDNVPVDTTDNPLMDLLDLEFFKVAELVEFSQLNDLYGNAQLARTEMQKYFRARVISSIFIDFDKGVTVKTGEDLNKNITQFLQELALNILNYAKIMGIDSNIQLFVDGKYLKNSFPKILTLAKLLFENFDNIKLNKLFANRTVQTEGIALQAYNSWVILNNFDMLLKNLLGKTIEIDENYDGTSFQDFDKIKYRVNKESNIVKTWRTSENTSAINELGSITKILLDSTPRYQYNDKLSLDNLEDYAFGQLSTKDVMYAFALIADHPQLRHLAQMIRYNPIVYVPMLIKTALDTKFKKDENNIKNILYSVYKRFFNVQLRLDGDSYSLVLIMNNEQNQSNYLIEDNLLGYITAMIDKSVPNNYMDYAVDASTGKVVRRFTKVGSIDTFKFTTQKGIVNLNNLLDPNFKLQLLLDYKITLGRSNARIKNPTEIEITFNYGGTPYRLIFDNTFRNLKLIDFQEGINNMWRSLNNILDKNKAKEALVKLLDNTLFMSFSNKPELVEQIVQLVENTDNPVEALAKVATLSGRILLKHKFDTDLADNKITYLQIGGSYGIDYSTKYLPFIDKRTGKIASILSDIQSSEIIRYLSEALMIISNEIVKSTIKNLEGNLVSAEGLTNYTNSIRTIWEDSKLLNDSAVKHSIFAKNKDLLTRITLKSAAQTSDRLLVKPDKKFNVAESGYSAIMFDFLVGFAKVKDDKGNFTIDGAADLMFQPTVYSDKTTNQLLNINKHARFEVNGLIKELIQMTPEEIRTLHFNTMSDMYEQMRNNIVKDYQTFYTALMSNPFIWGKLQPEINTFLQLHPEVQKGTFEYFKTIFFPAVNKFSGSDLFEGKTAILLFDEIIKPTSRVINEIHYTGKNKLEVNPVLDYYFTIYNKTDLTLYKQQIAKNQAKFAKDCLDNFRIYWSDENGEVNETLQGAIATLGLSEDSYINNWVDPDTKLIIIGKVNGKPIFNNNLDEIVPGEPGFELNPILDAFYSYDLMISTQYITSTVGGCYGHINNFSTTNLTKGSLEWMEEEETGRLLTQYKRMVIYPATMHNYHQEMLQGCATTINVANFADIKAPVYSFLKQYKDLDAHDGAGFCVPWVSDLENNSLPGARVGIDKKTIGTNMDQLYLMSSEFKWALFALTNERIELAGKDGGVNLKLLMRKMTDRAWDTSGLPFDITKNYLGLNLSLLGFGKRIIFRAYDLYNDPNILGNHHYEVTNIKSVKDENQNIIPNQYELTLVEVDETGMRISLEFNVSKEINSNYKLWEAFGAELSEELLEKDGEITLIPSDSSSQLVTYFANNTGFLRTAEDEMNGTLIHPEYIFLGTSEEINNREMDAKLLFRSRADLLSSSENKRPLTLRDVYQPMKYSDISYAVNNSATKNGATNINPNSSWYDDTDLYYYKVSTKHFGVQMDADHHADDSELTEMSQVISALESNGYTHHLAKQAYTDLGAIVYALLKPYMELIALYYNLGNSKGLYEVVGKAFLNSFLNSSSNRSDLSDALIANLRKLLGDKLSLTEAEVWIPFSDNSILSKMISTITSEINKTAIKRKYTGIGAIMIPAYDLVKIYQYKDNAGNIKDATFRGLARSIGTPDDVTRYLEEQTANGPILQSNLLELGKSYITSDGRRITLDILNSIVDKETGETIKMGYYEARETSELTYQEDFTKGRNLLPSRTTFKLLNDESGAIYDIFDTLAVTNKLEFADWYGRFQEASDKIEFINSTLEELNDILGDVVYNTDIIDRLVTKIGNTTNINYIEFYIKQINETLRCNIVEAFKDLHNNHIVYLRDGSVIEVDPSSILQKEAELVLSKVYATKYGLTAGTNLNEVDLEFFRRLIEKCFKPDNDIYDIALKRNNGHHTYIVLKLNEDRLLKLNLIKQDPRVENDPSTNFPYRFRDGKKIMPFEDCKLYKDENGTEYVVTDNIEQFLDDESYETILINGNYDSKEQALLILKNSGDSELLDDYKNAENVDLIINQLKTIEGNQILKAAKKKWTSFQKSLEFTAARIPSQSMQSFMPMKVVGFTDSEDGKAYVSHFQAFLQGSDYDIDKVYLLGNEFNSSGTYIGWSPLFNLESYELLKASEKIPMPTGKTINIVTTLTEETLDCSEEISNLLQIEEALKSKLSLKDKEILKILQIEILSNLLTKINESNSPFIYCGNTIRNKFIDKLENLLNKHQTYFSKFDDDTLIKMTKNSVSSKIRRIINDPLNMVAAYSPIDMDDPREAAKRSPIGSAERQFSAMNPTIKWHMHEQNMVGKTAIGITAVGEKVLFALLFYYNEIAKSDRNIESDRKKQIRALFDKRIPLMKGSNGEKIGVLRNIIANVNIDKNVDSDKLIWIEYINDQINNLTELLNDPNNPMTLEKFDLLSEMLLMQLSVMADSALVNSALLSAATDNAKELILSKINANPDMLKIYTYCILIGVDFNLISDLMTSKTVSIVDKLAKSNVFDLKRQNRRIETAIKELTTGIKLKAYGIDRMYVGTGQIEGAPEYNVVVDFFEGTEESNGFWKLYIETAKYDLGLSELQKIKQGFKLNFKLHNIPQYTLMMRYIEDMINLVKNVKEVNQDDLKLFTQLLDYGEELRILGSILGINQGIKTNMTDKMKYLTNFEDLFLKRLSNNPTLSYDAVCEANPQILKYVSEEEFNNVIEKAVLLGIIDVEYDPNLGSVYISNFNALRFLLDPEYKLVAIELYDFIKGTINVLDVVDVVPHFKAMTEAAAVDFTIFNVNSSKFSLAYNLAKKISVPGLTSKLKLQVNRDVLNFLSDVITCKYFEDKNVHVNVKGGYYKPNGTFIVSKDFEPINLATPHGQASFKRWFENVVVPRLKLGKTSDNSENVLETLKANKFITDLMLTTSERTLSKDLKYLWTLPMNMSNINSDSEINNFVRYLSDFTALESYTYNNIPVVRLFAYYNLITYKNQYGQDSLTRIFDNYMLQPNNEMQDYFNYVGKLDYDKLLTQDDFSEKDLLLACAVQISQILAGTTKYFGLYVKIYNPETDTLDLYEWDELKAREARRGRNMTEEEMALREQAGLDDNDLEENSFANFDPECYRPLTELNNIKKDIMGYFPFLAFDLVRKIITKSPVKTLSELHKQGKVLIYNNCG